MITLASAVATTGAQTAVAVDKGPVERVVQAIVSATGTVAIEGSFDGSTNWVSIYSFTASGAQLVALFPYMRANISANTGAITVLLDAYKG